MILQIAWGVLLPAIVAGILWLISGWRLFGGVWAGSLAVGLGFSLGQYVLFGWPLPWSDATQGLMFVALFGALLGALESFVSSPQVFLMRAWLVAGLLFLILPWHAPEARTWAWGLMPAALGLIYCFEAVASKKEGFWFPAQLWAIATATAIALSATASVVLGLRAATLAGVMGAAVVAAWLSPKLSMRQGTAPVFVVLLIGLLFNGQYYSKLPVISAGLLALSPLYLWLGELLFPGDKKDLLFKRLAVLLIPLAIAVLLALIAGMPTETDPYAGYG